MGWFIAQSLAFIIIAALIGLAIGIWIGWVVWGRRARGKHTAEKAEAAARSAGASSAATEASGDEASADAGTAAVEADAVGTAEAESVEAEPAEAEKSDAEAVPALAAATAGTAAAAAESDAAKADAESVAGAGADEADEAADGDSGAGADATDAAGDTEAADAKQDATKEQGAEDEVTSAESDVVAEAEAVAREAAEAAAAQAAARLEAGGDAETAVQPEAAEVADDLQRLEGVGPKIAAALKAAGYTTYAKIAGATEAELREAVAGQGIKFAPAAASWADQAQYLVDNDAKGLEEYQDYLVGGQERRAKFNENVDYTDVDEIEGAEAKAAALAEDEAAAAAAVEPEPTPEPEPQDLQRIEGIGPKIEAALQAAGYTTYAKVAAASEDDLRAALTAGGITFAPAATTWADQAQYLVDGDEDGLKEYQDYLIGGQERRAKFNENVDYTDVDEIEGAAAKAAALAQDEAEAAAAPVVEPEPEPEPAPEPEPEPQDLQRIEGIGPKIESTLHAAGFATYAKIAAASEDELRAALATGGITFAPAAASWADQAQYLADGDETGLQEFQDYLIGGQDRAAKFRKDVDYTDVDEVEGTAAKAEAIAEDEAKAEAAEADESSEAESAGAEKSEDDEPTQSEVKA
ncbi:helix-hairpin-helix domain-containing protein [Promicromonospora sukumoe]|uniref:helix-hairpin-helix domain-containing protein n=1 Tax=Promicromonospora sukumoe TaxID=88382 RepID=UPI0037C856CF